MKFVNFGRSGLKVSQICLGCMSFGRGKFHGEWTLSEDDSMPFFRRAANLGINFLDTADGYAEGASERAVGRAIREYFRRDELVLATKFYAPTGPGVNERGASRKHIMTAVDLSLKRLGVDYIDLYQQHSWDPSTPIEETLGALDDLVRAGKVLHIGASNFKAWQLAKALKLQAQNGWTRFSSMQIQYNLVYREEEREMIPMCEDEGLAVMAWSSLARGFLAGNRARAGGGATARARSDKLAQTLYSRDSDFALQAILAEIATDKGVPPMEVALAWIAAKHRTIIPIVGTTKLEQLEQAAAALDVQLDGEEMNRLNEAYEVRAPFSFPTA